MPNSELAGKRIPRWWWDVVFYLALIGVLASVLDRDWFWLVVNIVVAISAFRESNRKVA